MIGRRCIGTWAALALGAAASVTALAQQGSPARQAHEPVRQGPDTVFDVPVDALFEELAGARATGRNARIGPEFVYWGYVFDDGREVFLFACAPLEDVDCEARNRQVCPAGGTVIARRERAGLVRDLDCSSVAMPGVGDLRPGCRDQEVENSLDVGVIQCN